MIDGGVVEVDALEDEGLADIVVGQVPEVLGGKGHLINTLEARVTLGDDMLLDQLHPVPSHDGSASVTFTHRYLRDSCMLFHRGILEQVCVFVNS